MISVLGKIDEVITQAHGVLEPLVRHRVLAHAGDAEGGGGAAEGDDEPVVLHRPLGEEDAPTREVEVDHLVAAEAEPSGPADVTNGLDDVARLHQRGGDLGKEGREEDIVLVADEPQLDVRTASQPPLEHAHGFHPREPAAEHDDACRHS